MYNTTVTKRGVPGEFEHDTRWTEIDNYTLSHLHPSSRPNHQSLSHALKHSESENLPDIGCPVVQGKFFAMQCRMLGVKHSLEVGTLGGYSAIWLLTENPQLRVTTVEFNEHHAKTAADNFEAAGVADRVEIIVGAGAEILPKLLQEIEQGKRERFGFTFIDADKLNNYNYFDLAVKMSVPRACIVVDNVVAHGKLVDAQGDVMAQGGRDVVERVGRDDRVDGTVLQTVGEHGYDGFLIAAVK
ncbi:MAG: hypothetical protein LQ351_006365 [Letrouitia transgressa]|nr:MAG: hypothetical protein LQ351_006365 [Letrouitia transgressa]